jgi:2-keto-myo-inositol isomerase
LQELKEMIRLAVAIDCEAIVLVPTNDVNDKRDSDVITQETVAALKALGPLFENNGIRGYVEPLGFAECSLRSKVSALQAIQESGFSNYKIVHDTFHHYLGLDSDATLKISPIQDWCMCREWKVIFPRINTRMITAS